MANLLDDHIDGILVLGSLLTVITVGLVIFHFVDNYYHKPVVCVDSRKVVKVSNVTTPGIGGANQKEYFLITYKDGSESRQLDYTVPTPRVGSFVCLKSIRK